MTELETHGAPEITRLLQRSRSGDRESGDKLMEVVYRDLRRVAGSIMSQEAPQHTLQPTALVHEAYLRIFRQGSDTSPHESIDWQDRAHFFAVAARQMRRILVDHARQIRASKRGRGLKVALEDAPEPSQAPVEHDVEAVDEALTVLSRKDAASAKVVELKFFGGLTDRETANVLGVSVAKVRRDWQFARAWLVHELQKGEKSRVLEKS